ncbi:porin family protein [Chitinophaga sp. XS-30]|uniref:porin family protein n=1 Tax=Chitinophaga sp. XS-30 TaxID=2604421 RepID=UPI0011DCDB25|nr:porin family protein [Chitinophaga sp. XS-30]QEH40221.1 PorT family protein [Chitinophaga sp. XS-30]
MTKKIVLSLMAVGLSAAAMAQVRVGIKGGLNMANITTTNSGAVDNSRVLPSFHIGAIADFPLSEIISFQPGVFYTGKGSKLERGDDSNVTGYFRSETNPRYIEVPLNFVGKIPVGGQTKLFLGVGPYAAFGVGGQNKYEFNSPLGEMTGESSIKWDDDTPFTDDDPNQGFDKYKRFDYGGNILAGVEFGNFLISAQYGLGLGKILSGSDNSSNDKSKNRVWAFSLGYLLGGNR